MEFTTRVKIERHGFKSDEDMMEVKRRERRRGPVGIMARGGCDCGSD